MEQKIKIKIKICYSIHPIIKLACIFLIFSIHIDDLSPFTISFR